ncbi:hypothetical protein PK35_07835 [Tamlana nanhaiensis]|uniref:Uncharacterized protein n=1 Tax=Neotamlana nanhaiensis TaxID=1382798 RepID=A0A0D7W175_9FLAO|nr:hypothetical protein PK35_07835 [Tamlana nanhaiensis]
MVCFYFLTNPFKRDKTNNTKNIKKHILAIPADAPAIPPKPKTPAISAMITNVIVQRNIILIFSELILIS